MPEGAPFLTPDPGLVGGLLAAAFFAGVVLLSRLLGLGLERSLAVAAIRCSAQLFAVALVLLALFRERSPFWTGAVFAFMVLACAVILRGRLRHLPAPLFLPVLVAVACGGTGTTLAVTGLALAEAGPLEPRVFLPLGGMVLGNSMNGISLALDRFFSDLRLRRGEVRVLVALGATPAEARRSSLRAALRAGLLPVGNNLAAVGLVFLPGMMSGQILAGAPPRQAALYQLLVMAMIAAATALGGALAVLLAARHAFDAEGALREGMLPAVET